MNYFKKKDFAELLFPVYNTETNKRDFREVFPSLVEHSEFCKKTPSLNFNKLFKYIVYVYDRKSPFLQIEDLVERKKEAAIEAGFIVENSKFKNSVVELLNCENKIANAMILRYCRLQGKEWANFQASIEAFYQINLQLISNIKDDTDDAIEFAKKKAALDKAADDFNERLNTKARRFLNQETSQEIHDDLWSLVDRENNEIKITPEDYAN